MEQKQKLIKKPKPMTIGGEKKLEVLNLDKHSEAIIQSSANTTVEDSQISALAEGEDQAVVSDTESVEQEKEEFQLEDVNIIPREYLHAQLEYVCSIVVNL